MLGVTAGTLAVLLVSGTSVAAFQVYHLAQRVQNNAVEINPDETDVPDMKGGFNVLVTGVDNDETLGAEFGPRDTALNDVNIVVHVNADHSGATALSIPRDLIVAHPTCTDAEGTVAPAMRAQPFNTAYARGGLPCVVDTAELLTGLTIRYAAEVGFNGVIGITDAIGGVPVCLTAPLEDPAAALSLPAGISEISGRDALGFLRSRYGVGDGSDLSRIGNQQQYLSSLLRKVQSDETITNPLRLMSLANIATSEAKLSTSLASPTTLVSMVNVFRKLDLATVALVQYPGTTDDPRFPYKVVPNVPVAEELMARILADENIAIGTDASGPGTVLETPEPDPGAPAEPGSTDPAEPGTGEGTEPSPTGTGAIEGVRGMTADQSTCTVPR